MKRLLSLSFFFVLILGVFLSCESMVDTNTSTDSVNANSTKESLKKGPPNDKGPSSEENMVIITEDDLGPSERPAGFPDNHTVPEEDWYTPTHGSSPLNTEGATYGFIAEPNDPGTSGAGSFLFDVPAGERSWILTDQYGTGEWHGDADAKEGTRFDEITELSYSTYINPGSDALIPAMQIMAETGDGSYLGLVFDPPSSEAVTGKWQSWSALRSDHPGWRLAWSFDYQTWDELLNKYPDAKILWSVGVAAGTWPNQDFSGYTDLLTIGVNGESTTFDFEPSPNTKNDCKKGGWQDYGFKNQGQCIRFVNTGQDSR